MLPYLINDNNQGGIIHYAETKLHSDSMKFTEV